MPGATGSGPTTPKGPRVSSDLATGRTPAGGATTADTAAAPTPAGGATTREPAAAPAPAAARRGVPGLAADGPAGVVAVRAGGLGSWWAREIAASPVAELAGVAELG